MDKPKPNTERDYFLTCASCGEHWIKRAASLPRQCPRCGDRHWNKPAPERVDGTLPATVNASVKP